jgi:DNA-binding transcriptional ArsR family regulator
MDEASSNPLDLVWRALADPTRRDILDALRDGPKTTGQLAERFESMTRFGVMKHLGVLEGAGLVIVRREGRERWNCLNAVPLRQIYERWVSRYEDQWAGSLLRLKSTVERKERMGVKFLEQPPRVAHVSCEIVIEASREKVYRAWFDDTANWFYEKEPGLHDGASHCQEKMGGKFYMDTPGGGFNVLGEITMIKPGKKIRIRGDCTKPEAMTANMTISFEDRGSGTRVLVEHRMVGEFPDELPAEFEEGWMDGLTKLKKLVESQAS